MQKELYQEHGTMCGEEPNTRPYTYLLKCLIDNTFYYGVKYEKGCQPSDFWIKYETSSKLVKEKIKKYGKDSFIFEIRKIFDGAEKARAWENRVLKRLDVIHRTDFMNKTNNISIAPMCGNENPMTRPEVIESFKKSRAKNPTRKPNSKEAYESSSKKQTGRKRPKEIADKISKSLTGHKHTVEFKEKCRNRQLGVKPSEENLKKKSESIKGRKRYTNGTNTIFRKPGTEPEGYFNN
jgi:hypothetical protein